MNALDFDALRKHMVQEQLEARNITDPRVLAAMNCTPRHLFVPADIIEFAYKDSPLPIGFDQTISQPYIVAYMLECLGLIGSETVLEVGTGSGYQTALLAQLASYVISIERHAPLAERAAQTLDRLDIANVEIHVGDGSQGLCDMAPFDAIIVSAAAPALPQPLLAQLDDGGGRLVIPVGEHNVQYLVRAQRWGNSWQIDRLAEVRFVPLIGRNGFTNHHRDDRPDRA